jgi:hypothetical protein
MTTDSRRIILFFIFLVIGGVRCLKNTTEEALLKVPEEPKLTKNEAVEQQEQVVKRQDQDVINHPGPKWNRAIEYPLQNGFADSHYSISGACKDYQDHDYLESAFNFPSFLQLVNPVQNVFSFGVKI